jgi:adenine-specific DNA-methyltransferase
LYLISTFPSLKIDIEVYPAVKQHLLSFGYDRIKQTGDKESRKKTNNQWFETQDAIGYWDDFSKQKIIWKRVGSLLKFCYDESGVITLDSTCFATGKFIKYLVAFLNSSIGNYLLQDSPKTGTGDLLVSVQAINPVFVPFPNKIFEDKINSLFQKMLQNPDEKVEDLINTAFYNLFSFSLDEIEFIEN